MKSHFALLMLTICSILVTSCKKEKSLPQASQLIKIEYRAKTNYKANVRFKDTSVISREIWQEVVDTSIVWYQKEYPVKYDLYIAMSSSDVRNDTNSVSIYINDSLKATETVYNRGRDVNIKAQW